MSDNAAAQRAFNFSAGPAALPLPVLQQVRDHVRAHTNADILSLYEQWITHPDKATEDKLAALGVMPMRPSEEGGC